MCETHSASLKPNRTEKCQAFVQQAVCCRVGPIIPIGWPAHALWIAVEHAAAGFFSDALWMPGFF